MHAVEELFRRVLCCPLQVKAERAAIIAKHTTALHDLQRLPCFLRLLAQVVQQVMHKPLWQPRCLPHTGLPQLHLATVTMCSCQPGTSSEAASSLIITALCSCI